MSSQAPPGRDADERYRALIDQEALHWGRGDADPLEPQLWDDPELDQIALAPTYRHLVERASHHASVLDLGCGDGDLAIDLASRGPRVTGLDLSPERIARAVEQARTVGLAERTTFEVADLNRVELPAAVYECVTAHDALHHILELDHLLDQAHRTLVPGGHLVVSDFIGAGRLERLVWAGFYGVLPTLKPYRSKWQLRHRLRAFLASEQQKRRALESGGSALHDASPFESISQGSIVRAIVERFEIVERFTYCPHWYQLVPKLRIPAAARCALLRCFRPLDEMLNRRGITHGSYVFVEGRKR